MKENKIVLITGGDKGIGKAITQCLSERYCTVVFTYNTNKNGAEQIMSMHPNTYGMQCNLEHRETTSALINQIIEQFGKVDILINNAGCDNDSIFTKMDEMCWNRVLDVNLRSLFYVTQQIASVMVKNNWGRIVNFTSIAASTGAFGKANYSASKSGITGFTKSLALELGGKGITVNAVAPGAIKTEMLMRIPDKYRVKILENIPSHQFGDPEDVANLVEFLVSDRASYINGQTIHINGGSYLS